MQITEAKKALERALRMAEQFQSLCECVQDWLSSTDSALAVRPSSTTEEGGRRETRLFIKDKFSELPKMREKIKSMQG